MLLVVPFSSSAWDKLGHDVSAMIAWENMTSKAKKNISKYLEGHDDIVYYASWMDYMGYVTKSGYSNEWFDHCVPVNKDFEYAEGDFPGDALMAVEKAIERLADGKYTQPGRLDRAAADQAPGPLPARHALSGSRHLQLPPVELLAESGRRGDSVPQRMGRHAFATALMRGALPGVGAGHLGSLHRRPERAEMGRGHAEGVGRATTPATASSPTTSSVPTTDLSDHGTVSEATSLAE